MIEKPDSGKKERPMIAVAAIKIGELTKALAASEAKHKTEIKKLWEYFRKQMARKQMKLAVSEAKRQEAINVLVHDRNKQLAASEQRIKELKNQVARLKGENVGLKLVRAEKDNQTIMLERRIGELEEYIERLKKENEDLKDYLKKNMVNVHPNLDRQRAIQKAVNQRLSELREKAE